MMHLRVRTGATLVHIGARLVCCLASTRWIISLLIAGSLPGEALAQDAWNFSSEVPCATTPVQGLPFQKCLISNVRTFRVGTVQAWRLTFVESKSEFAIGFYKMLEAHGVGGMSPVSSSSMAEWVRTADASMPCVCAQRTSGEWTSELDSRCRVLPRIGIAYSV